MDYDVTVDVFCIRIHVLQCYGALFLAGSDTLWFCKKGIPCSNGVDRRN